MRRLIVGFVVDASSSMGDRKDSVITGYNEYLSTLSKEPAEVRLSRTHFDDDVKIHHGPLPLVASPRLSHANYVTSGSTALYDGIGQTIRRLEQDIGREDRVLVVIMTDGEENMSQIWSLLELQRVVKEKIATGRWTFLMLGANVIDVQKTAREIGIEPGNVKSFALSDAGVADVFESLTERTVLMLTDGSDASRTFFSE